MDDLKYDYWLSQVKGIGPKHIKQLKKYTRSSREIYSLSPGNLTKIKGISEKNAQEICDSRKNFDLDMEWEKLKEAGIHFISRESPKFPQKLKDLPDSPAWLYYKGKMPQEDKFSVAIVGARACSDYARRMTLDIGERLADFGINIISGMARGVDGYAHRGALDHGGKTFAVLGCGVDIIYPCEHRAMYEEILAGGGGVISEYPPGTAPRRELFPARNRIISALSDIVIVTEARDKSGSLITADFALEQNRDVYVVPGRMDDINCRGSNRLIKQGAGIIVSAEDLIMDLGISSKGDIVRKLESQLALEKEEFIVYSTLDLQSKSVETISERTGFSPQELAVILMELVDRGFIEETEKGYYRILIQL